MRPERRVVRAAGFVPVEAKLRVPPLRPDMVRRGELVDRLREAAGTPLVLVTAPAGYGKTVAVAQWAAEDGRPFAWVTVDAADDDAGVLVTYLLLALQRVEAVEPAQLAAVADRDSTRQRGAAALAEVLRGCRRPFVLVLDDADEMGGPAATDVVSTVAGSLPTGCQLVLVGRSRAAVGRLVPDRPEPLEVGRDDLRLSRAEAAALLSAAGRPVTGGQVDELLTRSEGWAAGLYLGTVGPVGPGGSDRPVGPLHGTDTLLADYFRDEVLDRLPAEVQTWLVRASVLDDMCGPLCDAMLETTGSAARLRRLERDNAFVVPAERPGEWFRLHRLLAESLRAELQRREPQLLRQLHARAGRWLAENDDADRAVDHTIAAGELDGAARLVWRQAFGCFAEGQTATVQRWLDALTPARVTAQAKLALAAAWCALQEGRSADHWVAAAERGRYDAAAKGESESVAAGVALLHAVVARHGVAQMSADAQLAARLMDADDPWMLVADLLVAVADALTGRVPEAGSRLATVERRAAAAGAHQVRAFALAELALLTLDDDWPAGRELAEQAAVEVREHRLADVPLLAPVHCLAPLVAARDGRTDEAARLAQRCRRTVALAEHPAAWAGIQCRQLLARTALRLGDTAAARTLLSEAQAALAEAPDADLLRHRQAALWSEIEHVPLGAGGGATTLTSAELRVLQFLPTHLSFEDIGRQLFVSRNTVKTQAVAAYRKLGVNSRSEAVERAYALGLLDDPSGTQPPSRK